MNINFIITSAKNMPDKAKKYGRVVTMSMISDLHFTKVL